MEKDNKVLSFTANSDKLFFGDSGHGIARYDVVRYPIFTKLNTKMQGFFWKPNEIDMSGEKRSFDKMTNAEQFVFTSNLRRQILLDSVQGRAPSLVFLPHCTDPSLENCILTWGFFESIHSESYTHIIRAIYSNPSEVIDGIPDIEEIADCADQVTQAYDNMIANPNKENLYLSLVAANALEAIRFYVSFACTFSFAERTLVEGSAKTVKFIARDENEHLALTNHIIKKLPTDDKDFIQIIQDRKVDAKRIFEQAAEQEKQWARYLFKNGPIIGLSEKLLCEYIDYLLLRRMSAIGLSADVSYKGGNPLPWMDKYLSNTSMQVAPQEVEISAYKTSSIINDASSLDLQKILDQKIIV